MLWTKLPFDFMKVIFFIALFIVTSIAEHYTQRSRVSACDGFCFHENYKKFAAEFRECCAKALNPPPKSIVSFDCSDRAYCILDYVYP